MPFYYFFLEIPKKIVDGTLRAQPEDFPKPLDVFGVEVGSFEQLSLLLALCGLFLALVFVNGGFKYFINIYKGLLGERMLRRLRYQLYSRILRFPLPHFRKVSQGELIPMITAEVEPLGGFIGDAVALPMHQGGLLLTALLFIFMQDPILGIAAIALYPIQGYVIPKLQRRVNQLAKARVGEVRRLSQGIAETVSGAQEIHAHDTTRFELARFSHRLGRIFDIRYQIYRKKFFIKFLNNFMNQLTPFFFYSIGGYLAIKGELSLGSLLAVLQAYKDLGPPWRELLNYYQIKEDARIKYEQVVSQFEPANMEEAERLAADVDRPEPFTGSFQARNLAFSDDDVKIVDGVSFTLGLDQRVAIVGGGGSGKEHLTLLLARLLEPTGGRIMIGGRDLGELPEAVTGRRISFVGSEAYLYSATLGDNLFYGLKHRPRDDAPGDETEEQRRRQRCEAAGTGNSEHDVFADWIDYTAAGANSRSELTTAAIRALVVADMVEDVYRLGLRGTVDPAARPGVAERILRAREALRERLAGADVAGLIEPFDGERYNTNATLAENLLFGTPVGDDFDMDRLAENEYVLSVLGGCGLIDDLLAVGHEVACTMVELFSDLPSDHEFFEQFSFIRADELADYRELVGRIDRSRLNALGDGERRRLLSLPFKLIPARHALGLIDEAMQARLLEARRAFHRDLPKRLKAAVEFFDIERYNAASTLQDNILFGKIVYGQAQAAARIGALISAVIDELDLRETVVEAGLDFPVGVGGGRLMAAQRHKLAIARAVLKRPDVLIVSEATAALDGATQNRIMANLLEEFAGRCLIWALHRPSLASRFDRVLVMHGGRIVEEGAFAELDQPDTHFKELVAAQ